MPGPAPTPMVTDQVSPKGSGAYPQPATGQIASPRPPPREVLRHGHTRTGRNPRFYRPPPSSGLPYHAAKWPSATPREQRPPWPTPPVVGSNVSILPRPKNENEHLQMPPVHARVPPQPNRPPPQLPREGRIQPAEHNPAEQATLLGHAASPATASLPMSIFARAEPSIRISEPLPNARAADFPFRGSYRGMLIAFDRPYWDDGMKMPVSGDRGYQSKEEREEKRMRRRRALYDVRRYSAPEWLVEDSESEEDDEFI